MIKKNLIAALHKKMETTQIEMVDMIERENNDDALWLEGYYKALSDIVILIKKEGTKQK